MTMKKMFMMHDENDHEEEETDVGTKEEEENDPTEEIPPETHSKLENKHDTNEHTTEFERLLSERPEEERALIELRNLTNKIMFIDVSTIPGAGLGAFARRALACGVPLTQYTGEELTEEEFTQRYVGDGDTSGYVYEREDGVYIDASNYGGSGWARYINSAGKTQAPNVEVQQHKGKLLVVPVRKIERGEELLSVYGDEFWKGETQKER